MAASYPTSQQPQLVQLAPPQWQQPQLVQPVQQYKQQQYTSQYSYVIKQEEEAWQGSLGPQPAAMQPPTVVQVEVRRCACALCHASGHVSFMQCTLHHTRLQHDAAGGLQACWTMHTAGSSCLQPDAAGPTGNLLLACRRTPSMC